MPVQSPQATIERYLLDSSRHFDGVAQPGSITLLTKRTLEESIVYIVRYTTVQKQQVYACMVLRQDESGSWQRTNFLSMGEATGGDSSQGQRLAWCMSLGTRMSFVAIAVPAAEQGYTALRLRDSQNVVATERLEQNAAVFVTHQRLYKPFDVEVLDEHSRVMVYTRVG